ncbi:alpha/beta hydrolase (plasmid) [Komagataeibacter nataicola]|nr:MULTISPECIES: alpha/beta hydrolase [Komagataeibacter]WEQ57505.1 alpha/beta hydrolase [Komagataeibacter nataicola]
MLHGHPQMHLTWHKVAPALAKRFTIVAPDLRGYGDSAKPEGGTDHANYSKRAMAADLVDVMHQLGFERFMVVGHDRGGRVAHRMALDAPQEVEKTGADRYRTDSNDVCPDQYGIRPTLLLVVFLIQPAPLPERLISGDPDFFLESHIAGQIKIPGSVDPRVMAEYRRCYADPAMRHAACEDYRAAAGIDLVHDANDADRRIEVPLLALWGARGTVGALYDVVETWREKAVDVRGYAIDCGHSPQEEAPAELLHRLDAFL